jgi:polysaccharide export outer membrane protein
MGTIVRHFLLLLFLCGTAFPQNHQALAMGVSGSYGVGPGDVLDLKVFEVEELTRFVTVDSGGTISLPLLPPVSVAGLTTPEIEKELARLYREGRYLRDPQISVAVREFRSQPISILGAVEHPGVYQLQGRRRLLEVLAMAGGFSADVGGTITILQEHPAEAENGIENAGPEQQVQRAGKVILVRELLTLVGENPVIAPRDIIRVGKTGSVYVVGAVGKPGEYTIRDQEVMTVLRAVSLAAGPVRNSAPQKAKVLRQTDAGRQEIEVRINDILHGRLPDLALQANDILFVPESRGKGALSRGAEAAIQVGTGVAIWRR